VGGEWVGKNREEKEVGGFMIIKRSKGKKKRYELPKGASLLIGDRERIRKAKGSKMGWGNKILTCRLTKDLLQKGGKKIIKKRDGKIKDSV